MTSDRRRCHAVLGRRVLQYNGDVEIGFNQVSEILAAPGVHLVGPLPPAIQHHTLFTAAIITSSPPTSHGDPNGTSTPANMPQARR